MNNFIIIVLDGIGIGEQPDSYLYGDKNSNTLVNTAKVLGGLNLPNLTRLGLGNITQIDGVAAADKPIASFGKMTEVSPGKDSTSGHWELSGIINEKDFSYFPEGFPREITEKFLALTGCEGFLGNRPASGTEIIEQLGDEHVKSGFPIIYTSADSVFQIAAHEDVIPLSRLYEICRITRDKILIDPYYVGRVIARPFTGFSGNYTRTVNRKDFSLDPPSDTILDVLESNRINTVAIGKVNDLFNYRGISKPIHTKSNSDGMNKILYHASNESNSLIFSNLVDFDVLYGHRNDPAGLAMALEEFDRFIPDVLEVVDETDALVITADHGNDPTTPSTDHSREYVPLLYFRRNNPGKDLGIRKTFADLGKTVGEFFKVSNHLYGKSFL